MSARGILLRLMNLAGWTSMGLISGLGLIVFFAFCLAGFDLTKAAQIWGGFLTHFAAADPDNQRRVLLPVAGAWLFFSTLVALGMGVETRRWRRDANG